MRTYPASTQSRNHSAALDDRDPDEFVPHVREWSQQRRVG
jgi:hypothetical protein